MSSQERLGSLRPLGRLESGESYYAPIGKMRYDDDHVQCHLCGRWLKIVGAIHIRVAHGITLDEYREMFHLLGNVSTAAPHSSERKRRTMLEQIASGERIQPYDRERARRVPPGPPTVRRWRSLATLRPDLAAELHPTRNGNLDPFTLGVRSHRNVWWRGSVCGHEWQMSPNQRTSFRRGCPTCGKQRSIAATIKRNQQPIPAERSLAAVHPHLLAEWHPTRNPGLEPYAIAPGSERKIWWRCADCGHEWATAANDRTSIRTGRPRPHGCPSCARARNAARQAARSVPSRERSFGARYPHLLAQWHPTRNGKLDPYTIKPRSNQKIWWRCAECGHEWQATPAARARRPQAGCRSCASARAQRKRRGKSRRSRPP